MVSTLQEICRLPRWTQESVSKDGDVNIGGVFVIHSGYIYRELTFEEEPKTLTCEGFYVRYYRDVLAMVFAIRELNQATDLLPNITLGFQIFDSCISEDRAIKGTLALLSGNRWTFPGYRCATRPLMAGIIGETFSFLSVPMARIMGVLHYPQISHSAGSSFLSDKLHFPSFLRTVPGNSFQNTALAQLLVRFSWTWLGMVISDTDSGIQGGEELRKEIERQGGCVAFIEKVHQRYTLEQVLRVIAKIRTTSVTVIIVHSAEVHVKLLLETLHTQNVQDKIWIFSAYFAMTFGLFDKSAWKILNGALGLAPYTTSMPGFEDFLQYLKPTTTPEDVFIKLFWVKVFSCKWPLGNATNNIATERLCSGNEALDQNTTSVFELNDLSYTYHSYLAVYAFAYALHTLMSCTPGQGPFTDGTCADINDIQPWQILHYLKNLHFKTRTGEEIYFDEYGDAPASYDILNVQISEDGIFRLVKVGKCDPRAPQSKAITVNASTILWGDGSSQVPRSVCSASCPPGYRRATREGEPVCCFDCIPCSLGEVSNDTDAVKCLKCPDDQWSNERRDHCIKKIIEFLSYEEPLGMTLTASAAVLALLAAFVMFLFIKYRDSPIVKANNRGLSYLLLISLMASFLCAFMMVGRPRRLTCMLQQTVFGVIFSLNVSIVLAKTLIVVLAFKATHPNSRAKRWLGSKTPKCVISLCCLIQVLICVVWLLRSPPFPELNTVSYNEKIVLQCNEGEAIFFYCMLGYMGLLATVSFLVAFISRNLPGSFNEAKLITFSMLVFVSVWISFIPAYLSTRGKYMVAVEAFAILCSSAGLLSCMFLPKCYIILLRPEENTKKHIVGKSR
ncbi:extracellular calcium-sensing receptor-like [Lissotriton helveticus]